ncbi:MAG: hypothetical protein ABR514_09555, partial [Chthoniobacterales bacterium]
VLLQIHQENLQSVLLRDEISMFVAAISDRPVGGQTAATAGVFLAPMIRCVFLNRLRRRSYSRCNQ